MIEEIYEEQVVFGNGEEQKEQIKKLELEEWVTTKEVWHFVPFGINAPVVGTLMCRVAKNELNR